MEDDDLSCLACMFIVSLIMCQTAQNQTLKITDCKKWQQAMNEEIESLKTNNTWVLTSKKC